MLSAHHQGDMADTLSWSEIWDQGPCDVYKNCPQCNYPFVGMFFKAGLMSLVREYSSAKDLVSLVRSYQGLLLIIDAMSLALIFLLLTLLRVQYPLLITIGIALLPSTWAGGFLWGQLDGLTQFIILLCLYFSYLTIVFLESKKIASAIMANVVG